MNDTVKNPRKVLGNGMGPAYFWKGFPTIEGSLEKSLNQ